MLTILSLARMRRAKFISPRYTLDASFGAVTVLVLSLCYLPVENSKMIKLLQESSIFLV